MTSIDGVRIETIPFARVRHHNSLATTEPHPKALRAVSCTAQPALAKPNGRGRGVRDTVFMTWLLHRA